MNSDIIQLLVLAGVVVFLVIKLMSVLGTREGFEKPAAPQPRSVPTEADAGDMVDETDYDILDNAGGDVKTIAALEAMKKAEPSFSVGGFLQGSRGAYEMILMAFERGDMRSIENYLSRDVFDAFASVVDQRADAGLTVEAEFIGVRDLTLVSATYDDFERMAEIAVKFTGELTSVAKDENGTIVEGDPKEILRQKDVWTFGRTMGANDPNWQLIATGG